MRLLLALVALTLLCGVAVAQEATPPVVVFEPETNWAQIGLLVGTIVTGIVAIIGALTTGLAKLREPLKEIHDAVNSTATALVAQNAEAAAKNAVLIAELRDEIAELQAARLVDAKAAPAEGEKP